MAEFGYFLLVLASVFFILDPFANIPLFISFLEKYSQKERKKIIRKSTLIAFLAFFFFSFFGTFVFAFLGIEIFSFKIAGGILLFIIALEMLFGFKTRTELTVKEQEEAELQENLAITPLAIPLITGPGAIITGIVLVSRASGVSQLLEFAFASTTAFAFVYFILLQSKKVLEVLGPTGVKVVTRVIGLLLMSIAVQFVLNGLNEANIFFA